MAELTALNWKDSGIKFVEPEKPSLTALNRKNDVAEGVELKK